MEKKFKRFYKEYTDFMYHIAYNILKDNSATELAVQRAFIRIHKNFRKVRDVESPETKHLALAVTRRTAIDIYRQRQKQKAEGLSLEKSAHNRQRGDATENDAVVGCIRRLPKKYTDILILKYVLGYRPKEIAELLGVSPRAVRSYLLRGKKLLRDEFKKDGVNVRI